MSLITQLAKNAATSSRILASLTTEKKNAVLLDMAHALRANATPILAGNEIDLVSARENNLAEAMIDRLTLNAERINDMAEGIETIAKLDDPVGQLRDLGQRPNGLKISKMRIPLGVVCMIYEARPNVTADAGALCFKSGNAVILRGGREALNSSKAIAEVLHQVLRQHELPEALITIIPNPDRALLMELMAQREYIDVIIPRGGEGLIQYVTDNSKIPVIQHFKGVCHLYIDKDADLERAINLLVNGKTQRTGVCNALEGLIVHKDIADKFLPLAADILSQHNVVLNGCNQTQQYIALDNVLNDNDFGQEYLDLEIAIKLVDDLQGAFDHIAEFGSNHTEVICTENATTANLFQRLVDASVVMVNASSRFSDGSQLGLGAEIGIATTKLHAYGPMGLESLTAEKYIVNGHGQIRN
ncbi:glutamate-5-semialdehyde dehydrogenase [Flocculibacter collagenilyticus]|uniref:glutamate-5-semialdehyde dehydrogenase n=1 Tax=Flocculibacter collagenilyticus TaxID=2744479 RepID=UPI0018F317CE|nr:glutamate-5-semialdehyde dehydrogenase [Flocculibacter collagenilyticus]